MIAASSVRPDFSQFGPIGLVVIQSTSLCNLDCSYCYLPDRQKKRVFDLDLIPLLVERIFESPYAGPEFSLVWHAGEPLTLPTNWYDKATTLINQSLQRFGAEDLEIDQHVQTNATLINNDWCDCFRRNQIVVGISVDGPEDIHDAHRRFRNGRGSHAMAMRGIEALHRNQVPFHCISVITADAMEQPERMYRFYRDNGINDVGFNVEEKEGINTSSSMAGSNMEAKYKDFLRTFWRLSEQDGYPVVLREFEQVISLIQGDRRMKQNELNRPFSILSVDAQGDFSTFDPELLSVASDGEQLWIERGEVPLGIHTQNGEGAVQFVLLHAPIPLDQADHLFKFAQDNGITVLLAESPKSAEKVFVFRFHIRACH